MWLISCSLFSLGYILNDRNRESVGNKTQDDNDVQEQSWRMGREIAKVLEVGAALGVDFNSKKESIGVIIAQREREDQERLAETNVR